MMPDGYSNLKPDRYSDLMPDTIPIRSRTIAVPLGRVFF